MLKENKIILKKGREKAITNRHPWIFSGAIEKMPVLDFPMEDGEMVSVYSIEDKFLGHGFYGEKSQITVRLFDFPQEINESITTEGYWIDKIQKAKNLRETLIDFSKTNAYRLIHAEGDFFPGLICDVYAEVAVLQILIKGTERILPFILKGLESTGIKNIYLKTKSSSKHLESITLQDGWLLGGSNEMLKVVIKEHENLFTVDIKDGQKTGFFIDQRENRLKLQEISAGKKVLNTFSYSGGFSVYALKGGASEVLSVDISKEAIRQGNENVLMNFTDLEPNKHSSSSEDVFEYLQTIEKDYYDIIVLDPPAFAKHAGALNQAARGYKQINLQAFRKIKPGGMVMTYSCSQIITPDLFRKIVFSAASDAHRNVRIIEQLHQPLDHPINIFHPESEYLKGLLVWVE